MPESNTGKIQFHRSGNSNYMVMESHCEVPAFEEQMLSNNEIPILLPFSVAVMDGHTMFWYDITAKKSLKHLMENGSPGRETVLKFLSGIMASCRKLSDYLIDTEHVNISSETVYMSGQDEGEVFLCYSPDEGRSLREQLLTLYEYLMGAADPGDEELTDCIYDTYELISEEGFSFDEVEKRIYEASGKNRVKVIRQEPREDILLEEAEEDNRKPEIEPIDSPHKTGMDLAMEDVMEREVTFDDVFEEEEKGRFMAKITGWFMALPKGIKKFFFEKQEEYFPPKDLEEDLIYDPSEKMPGPTALLSEDMSSCFGKLVYEGDLEESDYMLDRKSFSVGSRDRTNDALLHSAAVSRHHARIIKSDGGFVLEDLNSTNGTFLNGTAINPGERLKLHYMDKITFADVPYRIV